MERKIYMPWECEVVKFENVIQNIKSIGYKNKEINKILYGKARKQNSRSSK
jgi:microsomal dipeptidase-like Zn-dependent dipeptidase